MKILLFVVPLLYCYAPNRDLQALTDEEGPAKLATDIQVKSLL